MTVTYKKRTRKSKERRSRLWVALAVACAMFVALLMALYLAKKDAPSDCHALYSVTGASSTDGSQWQRD